MCGYSSPFSGLNSLLKSFLRSQSPKRTTSSSTLSTKKVSSWSSKVINPTCVIFHFMCYRGDQIFVQQGSRGNKYTFASCLVSFLFKDCHHPRPFSGVCFIFLGVVMIVINPVKKMENIFYSMMRLQTLSPFSRRQHLH